MSEVELKACPFCGSPATHDCLNAVHCTECGAGVNSDFDTGDGSGDPVTMWNRRSPAQVEGLRETKADLVVLRNVRRYAVENGFMCDVETYDRVIALLSSGVVEGEGPSKAEKLLADMWRRWCDGVDADDLFATSQIKDILALKEGGGGV